MTHVYSIYHYLLQISRQNVYFDKKVGGDCIVKAGESSLNSRTFLSIIPYSVVRANAIFVCGMVSAPLVPRIYSLNLENCDN